MTSKLTMEALEKHHQTVPARRMSVIQKDGSTPAGLNVTGPNLRRQSRTTEHRLSVPHAAGGRRPSQVSRTSISGTSVGTKFIGQPIKLQNTYRMEPERNEMFNSKKVETIMHNVLESYLKGEVYDSKICTNLAQNLTDVIKGRVKELGFTRYKLVCNVIIGQNSLQDVRIASRCLWDSDLDNFATASYKNKDLFAIGSVYATYFE